MRLDNPTINTQGHFVLKLSRQKSVCKYLCRLWVWDSPKFVIKVHLANSRAHMLNLWRESKRKQQDKQKLESCPSQGTSSWHVLGWVATSLGHSQWVHCGFSVTKPNVATYITLWSLPAFRRVNINMMSSTAYQLTAMMAGEVLRECFWAWEAEDAGNIFKMLPQYIPGSSELYL